MTAELVPYVTPQRRTEWVELMAPTVELAKAIADTEFVPADLRNRPAAITACILYGAELGLGPMQSLAKIDLVKGRPAPRAELARALALAAGHSLWVEEQTNTRVVMKGRRRGESNVSTVTWSMDDARKAGIAGNPAYAKYPRQMLLARASAELVRQIAPEVLGGIVMVAEEAVDGDLDGADMGSVGAIDSVAPVAPAGTRKRSRPAKTAAKAQTATDEPHPADEPDLTHPTEAQTKLAMALFTELAITERDERLHATTATLGHPVESWNDVTRDQASTVINTLEAIKAGTASFAIDTDGVWSVATHDDELLDET